MIEKKSPNFLKNSQNSGRAKNAKISASKLNSKVRNSFIKSHLKPLNTYNQPCLETAHLVKNVNNSLSKKQHKMLPFVWASSSLQKITMSLQK
jgi:hypothetical protein